ncbi:MAG: hydrogenase nickel incorporation protein HypA, partial [Candidatus Cloacimonetes bacterium]|nr:hydrogenase nickel incorporation protein HypA [Candidatus Cloacimonadota bacterium]MBS3766690.1 hydrogenase nickel incorporation protein HypA [Candidatus Cloacimonadota bacterium]
MHEWALADAVLKSSQKVAEKEDLEEVTDIFVKIGELQSINKEIFHKALEATIEQQANKELFRNVNFSLEIVKAELQCNNCGHKWLFEDAKNDLEDSETESIHFIPETAHVFLQCPKCNSQDFKVIHGRGIWLEAIEGEKKNGS